MRIFFEIVYVLVSLFLGIAIMVEYGYEKTSGYMNGLHWVSGTEEYHYAFIALGIFVIILSGLVVAALEDGRNE